MAWFCPEYKKIFPLFNKIYFLQLGPNIKNWFNKNNSSIKNIVSLNNNNNQFFAEWFEKIFIQFSPYLLKENHCCCAVFTTVFCRCCYRQRFKENVLFSLEFCKAKCLFFIFLYQCLCQLKAAASPRLINQSCLCFFFLVRSPGVGGWGNLVRFLKRKSMILVVLYWKKNTLLNYFSYLENEKKNNRYIINQNLVIKLNTQIRNFNII